MKFRSLSNSELVSQLKTLASEERKILTEILHLLREAESRRIYALWGYPSLFEFAVKELGYCESSAYRRIEAMRLLKSLPAQEVEKVEVSLIEGRISLTNLSTLQGFVRRKEVKENQKLKIEDKKELLEKIQNQSTRKCQEILFALNPDCALKSQEREKPISENRTEIKIVISNALLDKLNRIKSLRAHVNPNMSTSETIEYLAEVALDKIDP